MPANLFDLPQEERPHKRVRSNVSQEAAGEQMPSRTVVHDADYYFEDGSVVFLIECVLFKVHRSRLTRDSSTFETLFGLPNGVEGQPEGGRDADPVVLHGDTPDQFRSLLWALYALPHEIIYSSTPNAQEDWPDFDRFCDLSLMAHKYCFKSLETWALSTFLQWISPTSRHALPRIHGSTAFSLSRTTTESSLLERLRRVLELAVLCDDAILHAAVVQRLQDELGRPDADLSWFIALAERFEVGPLTGAAYYALMIQGRDRWISLANEGRLTHSHLGKLHNGYYTLVGRWERYRVTPPIIPQCMHYGHNCRQRWQAYWKELTRDDLILSRFPADVLGRLETVLSQLYAYTGIMDMHQECRNKAVNAVRSFLTETKECLASSFVDIP